MPSLQPPPHSTQRSRLWALLWMAPGLLPLAIWLLTPGGTPVQLTGKTWRRDIEIETRVADHGSAWCDELPAGAKVTLRRLISDPTGARPAPAEHCRYAAPQWRALHSATAEGGAADPPRWPEPGLAPPIEPVDLGAERPGKRHQRYEIQLLADSGQHWTCRLSLQQWQALSPGLRFRLRVDRHGVADCSSVPGSSPP